MSDQDSLHLDVDSDPSQLPTVRDTVRQWAGRHGWKADETADIVLAIDEALTNVIRHGYDGQPGHQIEVAAHTLRDAQGQGVEIRIRDYGKQVPLDRICGRDLDDIRPGGLGVHIIRSVMTSAEYSHADGGGMQLVMRKYQRSNTDPQDSQAGKP